MRGLWIGLAWLAVTAAVGGYLVRALVDDRRVFLPGHTTAGHYQIEVACEECHVPMEGVSQSACERCHADELDSADDSHGADKFRDPRNAAYVDRLDARRCATCHGEHAPGRTRAMGVTVPAEFCRTCHADIGIERASHADLPFSGCASTGCHNYHDNRALTVEHLTRHADEPALLATPIPAPVRRAPRRGPSLTLADRDGPAAPPPIADDWAASAHARRGVNCSDCHGSGDAWRDAVDRAVCADCHARQVAGFEHGRHGMRAAAGLSPMRPSAARLPMRRDARRALDCATCHDAHTVDTKRAAADACLGCHADDHSLAWRGTPHAAAGVTCATCHLPRIDGATEHDQNAALRPRTTMIRPVCQRCHGLGFSLDALADDGLVDTNYDTAPGAHVPSIEMALTAEGVTL